MFLIIPIKLSLSIDSRRLPVSTSSICSQDSPTGSPGKEYLQHISRQGLGQTEQKWIRLGPTVDEGSNKSYAVPCAAKLISIESTVYISPNWHEFNTTF